MKDESEGIIEDLIPKPRRISWTSSRRSMLPWSSKELFLIWASAVKRPLNRWRWAARPAVKASSARRRAAVSGGMKGRRREGGGRLGGVGGIGWGGSGAGRWAVSSRWPAPAWGGASGVAGL